MAQYLQAPLNRAEATNVPRSRLVVGEFGCTRRLSGCRQYLEDVLGALDQHRVHWAFYSLREDSWDGMDYELGTAKVPWRYWQAIDQGLPDPLPRQATPAFEPIRKRLAIDQWRRLLMSCLLSVGSSVHAVTKCFLDDSTYRAVTVPGISGFIGGST